MDTNSATGADFARARLGPKPAAETKASTNLSLVGSSVSGILGLQSDEVQRRANAEAQGITAEGYQAEIDAYGKASGIAEGNAGVAQIASDVKALQADREMQRSMGTARANAAGQGVGTESGSSVDIMRMSMQEGFLNQQLIQLEGAIDVSGYHQQAAAYQASSAAAKAARDSARATADAYTTSADVAAAQAANQTAALTDYLKNTGLDKESQAEFDLITGTLDGTATGDQLSKVAESSAGPTEAQTGWEALQINQPWNAQAQKFPTPGITGYTPTSSIVNINSTRL